MYFYISSVWVVDIRSDPLLCILSYLLRHEKWILIVFHVSSLWGLGCRQPLVCKGRLYSRVWKKEFCKIPTVSKSVISWELQRHCSTAFLSSLPLLTFAQVDVTLKAHGWSWLWMWGQYKLWVPCFYCSGCIWPKYNNSHTPCGQSPSLAHPSSQAWTTASA